MLNMTNIGSMTELFWAILAIGVGAIFLFFGVKVFRAAVGLAGFGAFGLATYILIGQIYGSVGIVPQSKDIVRLGISLGCGILGGFISIWLWKVALFSLGGLGGIGLSIYILSWRSNGLLRNATHRSIFMSVFGIAGAFLSMFFENVIVIIGTSIVGALSLFTGIDMISQTGFKDAMLTIAKNRGSFTLNSKAYGMLAGCGGAAAAGSLFQYFIANNNSAASAKGKTIAA